jgi:hypothetical protein
VVVVVVNDDRLRGPGVRARSCAHAGASYSAQDRTYYRVCCRGPAGEQVFDLFHDAITNLWVLDVAHD